MKEKKAPLELNELVKSANEKIEANKKKTKEEKESLTEKEAFALNVQEEIDKASDEKKDWIKRDAEVQLNKICSVVPIDAYQQNVEMFFKSVPFIYDRSKMYWLWNVEQFKWNICDEVDILDKIDQSFNFIGASIRASHKSNYLEAVKRVGRRNKPEDAPKSWIQFKGSIFDLKTKQIFPATPSHFNCNPIPWDLGESSKTPTIDKLFKEWVGEKYIQTLYEIIAYCCLIDYPIHLIFCFVGAGRNGKSRFQALLTKFLGIDNICASELDDLLDSRFEKAKLYKKLCCSMGETNFNQLNKTSLLKKLTGQDLVGFEFKNKLPFDALNYAKIIINSNSLPVSDDTSEGFYRRWLIIDFPNKFKEGKDILEIIPESEYNNLANKVIEILPGLIANGKFTNQGTIEERKKKFIMASNPISEFLEKFCDRSPYNHCLSSEVYTAYCRYLVLINRRVITRQEFAKFINLEGIEIRKTTYDDVNGYFLECYKLKRNWEGLLKEVTYMTNSSLSPIGGGTNSNPSHVHHDTHSVDLGWQKASTSQIVKLIEVNGGEISVEELTSVLKKSQIDKLLAGGLIMENPKGTFRLIE